MPERFCLSPNYFGFCLLTCKVTMLTRVLIFNLMLDFFYYESPRFWFPCYGEDTWIIIQI